MIKTAIIAFLGNSLTAGYGIPKDKAFPHLVGADLGAQVVNVGSSGATTASAWAMAKWSLKSNPTLVFLALGANDGLRGIDVDSTRKNLSRVISFFQKRKIPVVLAGMKTPPNYGKEYGAKFEAMFALLAKKHKPIFVPFLLEGVGGERELNLEDGIHPNEKGHQKIAQHVGPYLRQALEKK